MLAQLAAVALSLCILRDTIEGRWTSAEPKSTTDGSKDFATDRHGRASTFGSGDCHWATLETFARSAEAYRSFASTTAQATGCISFNGGRARLSFCSAATRGLRTRISKGLALSRVTS